VAARQVRLPHEDVAGRASAADPFEYSSFDELGEVVGGLGAAHAADFLVRPASQVCFPPVSEQGQGPLLRGLELLSSGSRHYSP